MNVGYRKSHHLHPLKSAGPRRCLCTHVFGKHSGGLICKTAAAVLFTLKQGTLSTTLQLTPTLGGAAPDCTKTPHTSKPRRRNDEHIVGIRFIQYVNGGTHEWRG